MGNTEDGSVSPLTTVVARGSASPVAKRVRGSVPRGSLPVVVVVVAGLASAGIRLLSTALREGDGATTVAAVGVAGGDTSRTVDRPPMRVPAREGKACARPSAARAAGAGGELAPNDEAMTCSAGGEGARTTTEWITLGAERMVVFGLRGRTTGGEHGGDKSSGVSHPS